MKEISIIIPVGRVTSREKLGLFSIYSNYILSPHKIEVIIVLNNGLTKEKFNNSSAYRFFNIYDYSEIKSVNTARNIGLNLSKGKYVLFHDADDILLPHSLNIFLNDIKSNYDLYSYGIIRHKFKEHYKEYEINKLYDYYIFCKNQKDISKNFWKYPTNIVNKVIKKSCIDYDFENLSFSQDLNISYKLLPNVYTWQHNKTITYVYICDDSYGMSGRNKSDTHIKNTIEKNYSSIIVSYNLKGYNYINYKLNLRFNLMVLSKIKSLPFKTKYNIFITSAKNINIFEFQTFLKTMSLLRKVFG